MLKRKLMVLVLTVALVAGMALPAAAAATHKVVTGDTMWKIAVRYQMGVSEIINANRQISNPNLIYPGNVLNIPSLDSQVQQYEQEVVRLVNNIRTQNGLKPLTMNWELSRVARYKSEDMLNKRYFDHTSPTYGSPFDMMRNFGISFRTAGENIAMGYRTPDSVVTAWMNSEGHRKNILNSNFTTIGVGYVASGNYWTQMFMS